MRKAIIVAVSTFVLVGCSALTIVKDSDIIEYVEENGYTNVYLGSKYKCANIQGDKGDGRNFTAWKPDRQIRLVGSVCYVKKGLSVKFNFDKLPLIPISVPNS